ncbi:hypothetical protein B0H14DRAFT_3137229 [Mycena olivaceomarginata]|nr:hypothetical protein B0H14DRAFT_3137229 [Mycena olivaceomarginata]
MHFSSQTQVVLLAVLAVYIQKCVGIGAGEDGGMCKGPLGIPVPLTVCQEECPIPGNLPSVTCKTGLTCCLLNRRTEFSGALERGSSVARGGRKRGAMTSYTEIELKNSDKIWNVKILLSRPFWNYWDASTDAISPATSSIIELKERRKSLTRDSTARLSRNKIEDSSSSNPPALLKFSDSLQLAKMTQWCWHNDVPLDSQTAFIHNVISDGQNKLGNLEATVAQLTRKRDELAEDVCQHRAIFSQGTAGVASYARNSTHPIHQAPLLSVCRSADGGRAVDPYSVDLVLAHCSCWRTLLLDVRNHIETAEWLSAANVRFVALETLEVRADSYVKLPDIFSNIPSLRKVFLTERDFLNHLPAPAIPWGQITHYSGVYTVDSQVEILKAAPNMRSCAIGFIVGTSTSDFTAGMD